MMRNIKKCYTHFHGVVVHAHINDLLNPGLRYRKTGILGDHEMEKSEGTLYNYVQGLKSLLYNYIYLLVGGYMNVILCYIHVAITCFQIALRFFVGSLHLALSVLSLHHPAQMLHLQMYTCL